MTDPTFETAHEMIDVSEGSSERKRRKGGWPKGVPRPDRRKTPKSTSSDKKEELRPKAPIWSKMRAKPNWETDDFEGPGLMDGIDKLRIDPEIVDALQRDGVALQWATHSVRGMETPEQMMLMARGGWTPVHADDFDGVLDGKVYGMPRGSKNVITVGDCMLVARPAELHGKAKLRERQKAVEPMKRIEQAIAHFGINGIAPRGINVSGAGHKTALHGNHISKSYERIEIPDLG